MTYLLGNKGVRQGRQANIHSTMFKLYAKRWRVARFTGDYSGLISYARHKTLCNRYQRKIKIQKYGYRATLASKDLKRRVRGQLLSKQNGACAMCGEKLGRDKTIDHIKRLADGGTGNINNLQLLHRHCHDLKERDYDREKGRKLQKTLPQDMLDSINWSALNN